eukprot:jgi/Galph1/2077/GphlegSOOS_G734.1
MTDLVETSFLQLLPEELLARVLKQAAENNLAGLCVLRYCNKQFRKIVDQILLSSLEELDARNFQKRSTSCIYSQGKVESLKLFLKKCTHIARLELTRVFYAVDDSLLWELQESCRQLEMLDLSYCYYLTDKGISAVWSLNKLEHLIIRSCPNITSSAFLQTIDKPPSKLRILCLEWCPNLCHPAIEFIMRCPSLEHLCARGCENISDDCFLSLVHWEMLPSIMHLDIRFCMVGDAGLIAIARSFDKLQTLILGSKTHNLWPCGNWTPNGTAALTEILPSCKIVYS